MFLQIIVGTSILGFWGSIIPLIYPQSWYSYNFQQDLSTISSWFLALFLYYSCLLNWTYQFAYFRRLCIVKGIFPREPKKKVKGNHHTYYHVKDIAFLQHEPLLEKFREIKTYQKKVLKAKAKKNEELARLLLTRQPTYKLDRLIRERFASFTWIYPSVSDTTSFRPLTPVSACVLNI